MPKAHNSSKLILTNGNILQNSNSILLGTRSACYASPLSTKQKIPYWKAPGNGKTWDKMQITYSASQQQFLPSSRKQLKTKLVLAFMSADIPLFKLRNLQIISLCWPGASGAIGDCLSRLCPSTCWSRNKQHSMNNSRQEGIPYRWRKWIGQ